MPMHCFQHIAPPLRLFSGTDSLDQLGRELDRAKCRRAVIICGASLAREAKLLARVADAIGARCAGVFDGTQAHSPVTGVEAAVQALRRLDADAVVPVGGGSAIVTARAASILLAETASIESLCTTRDAAGRLHSPRLLAPKLPQFVVPTTPTTAIVKAGAAVFDAAGGRRLALYDPKTRAQSVFVHPDLVASAPRDLVISASLNAFSLAVEGLMSRTAEPLADALLMHALRLLRTHLAGAAPDGHAACCGLVHAAILCGQGTDFAGAGATTALGHAISTGRSLEAGAVGAILLPHVLRFNAEAAPAALARVAAALGLPDLTGTALTGTALTEAVVAAITSVTRGIGLPPQLRDLGLRRADFPGIAAHAMGDWFLRANPRQIDDAAALVDILEAAW